MKDLSNFLTIEPLRKLFKNNFDLVNYAIKLVQQMVKSGRDSHIKTSVQNKSFQILQEILNGRDENNDNFESRIQDLEKEMHKELEEQAKPEDKLEVMTT